MLLALGWNQPHLDRVRTLWPLAVLGTAAAVVFAWLCDGVGDHDGITAVDGPTATWFAAHRTLTEGQFALLIAKATCPAVLIVAVIAAALIARRRGHHLEATLLVAATVLAYIAGAIAKIGEHRARPTTPINLAPESEPSFPSGHVLVIATVALVALALAWNHLSRSSRAFATFAAAATIVVVSLDRLVVGAHWLTDVAGSLALAVVILSLTVTAHRLLTPAQRST